MIRKVNSTATDFFFFEKHRITRHYSDELQTTKQTQFTYSDFPCHLKANRDKLALINRRWRCEKGKGWPLTASSLTKIDQHDNFTRAVSRRYRDRGQR